MMTIAKSELSGWIAEEEDCIYAEHTQAEAQTQIEKTLVEMLQLGNNAELTESTRVRQCSSFTYS